MPTRRSFTKTTALGAAGLAFLNSSRTFANPSGANGTVNIAILGTGGRAHSLAKAISESSNVRLTHICDVDEKRLTAFAKYAEKTCGNAPATEKDFRKILELKEVDAVAVATPEHWHAPMAILAMQAGKHVYVEKPCSHNPHENELIVQVQKKTGKACQMGNQQRSSVSSDQAIKEIRDGVIGDVYAAKAFYANNRTPIGTGKVIPVPASLDWDLWQGPAPREDYRDNIHPYNWHWFRSWGTGEIHNNGTHEIDICRWALDVGNPVRVVSTGGRLSHKGDDWEWFDTQLASYEFEGGKTLSWEGRSCNGYKPAGGRGAEIFGSKGTVYLDRGKYVLYDLGGKAIKTVKEDNAGTSGDTNDTQGFDGLTPRHMQNFVNAITENETLHSPIADASISTHLCHLGNIAQLTRESLEVDPATGRVLNSEAAQALWKRKYENGWEPTL